MDNPKLPTMSKSYAIIIIFFVVICLIFLVWIFPILFVFAVGFVCLCIGIAIGDILSRMFRIYEMNDVKVIGKLKDKKE